MGNTMIAAQMYTLRDFLKTPADIATSLAKVRQIGYRAVQLSGLGDIDPAEMKRILDGEGLTCCATHTSMQRMGDDTAALVAELKSWGCPYTAIGGFFPENPPKRAWLDFAEQYNAVAKKFAGTGVTIGYHNHSHELAKYDGRSALEILLEHLDPSIWFEIDTYWIQHGGGDPAAWIEKCAGRIPCVHLKDMVMGADRKQQMAEVGEGNLNWPAILKACGKAGVKWYIIEQDVCQRDPFESLKISLENVKGMGLE